MVIVTPTIPLVMCNVVRRANGVIGAIESSPNNSNDLLGIPDLMFVTYLYLCMYIHTYNF